ncbi:hypothetical protein [Pseudogemmobacter sonorensis]|uniref:hypothetical protein n=1 Tax=Pseudogemmobacter sonorensis TaxID=2989681 RepID=UPI00369B6D95
MSSPLRPFRRLLPPLAALCALMAAGAALSQSALEEEWAEMAEFSLADEIAPGMTLEDLAAARMRHHGEGARQILLRQDLHVPLIDLLAGRGAEGAVMARTLTARLLWSHGLTAEARAAYLSALDLAGAEGIADALLTSPLLELARLELDAGDTARAGDLLARALVCAPTLCPGDLMRQPLPWVLAGDLALPRRAEVDLAVEGFLERHLARPAPALASYLGGRALRLENSHPIEAAEYMERAWLTGRLADHATRAVELAVKANRFARAIELAAEAEAWLDSAAPGGGPSQMQRLTLHAWSTRARLRGGDPAAGADYTELVERALALPYNPPNYNTGTHHVVAGLIMRHVMDTDNLAAAERLARARLAQNGWHADRTLLARILYRRGAALEAAALLAEALADESLPDWKRAPLTVQQAVYLRAGGATAAADALLAGLAAPDYSLPDPGLPLPEGGVLPPELWNPIGLRDEGNHEGAAWAMAQGLAYVPALAARGRYSDAQWLWQVAFTLALGGEPEAAFRVMSLASGLAVRLSFADPTGEAGGSLQLMRRDNWRYLLFVDIAWATAQGRAPEAMLVVSDY